MTHQIKACGNKTASFILNGIFLVVVFCVVFFFAIPVFADPIPRLSDQKFQNELIEMTSEYDKDVTRQQAAKNPYINERLIVKSYDSTLDPDDYGAVDAIRDRDGHYIIQFESSLAARRAQQKLEQEASVLYVEPDIPVFAQEDISSKQDTLDDWDVSCTNCDAYADYLKKEGVGGSVRIALLDSGILASHQLLKNRIDSYSQATSDEFGHGTKVAGIVVKNTPGLNQIRLIPIKVLDKEGIGDLSIIQNKIFKISEEKTADVLNLSFNSKNSSTNYALNECIKKATEAGIVVVVSAGNQTDDTSNHPPANITDSVAPGCIIVSSCNSEEKPAASSNYGESVDLCAPGEGVKTAGINSDTPIETVNGTSFSAPCVAAAAAMLKLKSPTLSPSEIESLLEGSVKRIINPYNRKYGSGILDLASLIPTEYYSQSNVVTNEINNLSSEITLKDQSEVETVRDHFNMLPTIQKRHVNNYSKLTNAETKIRTQKAEVTNLMNDINSLSSKITLNDENTVNILCKRYQKLNEDQKALVTNISKLERAEQTVNRLRLEVNNLEDEIHSLPSTVTLADKTKVESLRKQFSAMTPSQQANVMNISILKQAEQQISVLVKEAQDIIDAISRLSSSVTLQDKAAVEALMKRYYSLSPEQQDLVTNFSKLDKAEQTIASLKEKAEEVNKEKYEYSKPHANVTYRVPLKKKQTTKALKVIGLAGEDKVVKMVSSDKKKATVRWNEDGTCAITAGKKTGSVTITASCASGKKVTFRIKVQKKKVKTKKIQIASRKVYLSAGDKLALKPELYPITSAQKITYISKNKSVVQVTKTGVIRARKKGSAVIVIKSGKKKLKVKVVVN